MALSEGIPDASVAYVAAADALAPAPVVVESLNPDNEPICPLIKKGEPLYKRLEELMCGGLQDTINFNNATISVSLHKIAYTKWYQEGEGSTSFRCWSMDAGDIKVTFKFRHVLPTSFTDDALRFHIFGRLSLTCRLIVPQVHVAYPEVKGMGVEVYFEVKTPRKLEEMSVIRCPNIRIVSCHAFRIVFDYGANEVLRTLDFKCQSTVKGQFDVSKLL